MHELLERLPADQKEKLVAMPEPEWEDPMLATLTHHYFSDTGWVYGRKLDGVRCITYREGNELRLMSRTHNEMSASFPEVREKDVHWVEPALVAEIGFENWTNEGRLRQPRYRGLRYDKNPTDVVREG